MLTRLTYELSKNFKNSEFDVRVENDIIEVQTQKDSVVFITTEFFGFKIYVGYQAPNSIDFEEIQKIIETVKDVINPNRRTI